MDNLNFLSESQKEELESKISAMNYDDVKKQMANIDKNAVLKKLKDMGFKSIADKYANISDGELMKMLANNPDILKKLKMLLKQ